MSMLNDLDHLEQLHGELLSQAKVLLGLLEQGEEEAFDNAWAQRQQVFKALDGLHRRLAPDFARWGDQASGMNPADEERARRIFSQVRKLGRQVLEIDRRAAELLQARRADIVQDLGRIKEGQKARQAYGGGSRRWWGPDKVSRTG